MRLLIYTVAAPLLTAMAFAQATPPAQTQPPAQPAAPAAADKTTKDATAAKDKMAGPASAHRRNEDAELFRDSDGRVLRLIGAGFRGQTLPDFRHDGSVRLDSKGWHHREVRRRRQHAHAGGLQNPQEVDRRRLRQQARPCKSGRNRKRRQDDRHFHQLSSCEASTCGREIIWMHPARRFTGAGAPPPAPRARSARSSAPPRATPCLPPAWRGAPDRAPCARAGPGKS